MVFLLRMWPLSLQGVIPDLVNVLEALRTVDLKVTAEWDIGTKMAPPILLLGGSICSLLLKTNRPNTLTVGVANWNRILLQEWMPLSEVWIS